MFQPPRDLKCCVALTTFPHGRINDGLGVHIEPSFGGFQGHPRTVDRKSGVAIDICLFEGDESGQGFVPGQPSD